jgi:integrase
MTCREMRWRARLNSALGTSGLPRTESSLQAAVFRLGMRAAELCDQRWEQVEFGAAVHTQFIAAKVSTTLRLLTLIMPKPG